MPTLAELLYTHEGAGNYDTLFGHSQRPGGKFAGVKPSEMTIGQVLDFQNPSGPYGQWVKSRVGRVATPAGYGQIVGTTLRRSAEQMGLSHDTPFDAETQTAIVNHLAKARLAGVTDPAAKRAALRAEWEGFKNVSNADLDAAIAQFESGNMGAAPGSTPRGPRINPDGSIGRGLPTPQPGKPMTINPDGSIGSIRKTPIAAKRALQGIVANADANPSGNGYGNDQPPGVDTDTAGGDDKEGMSDFERYAGLTAAGLEMMDTGNLAAGLAALPALRGNNGGTLMSDAAENWKRNKEAMSGLGNFFNVFGRGVG